MAKSPKDDDLFASSTMTFGEHLEELRGALFRSLAGLVIAFLIGLFIATYVVQWVQSPLAKALDKYYLETALMNLDREFDGNPPPEMLALIKEERLVPEKILVEPFGFLRRLSNDYPDQFGQVHAVFGGFVPADLPVENVAQLARDWVENHQTEGSAAAALWHKLSDKQRDALRELATSQHAAGRDQRQQLLAVLNALVQDRALRDDDTLKPLLAAVNDGNIRRSVESLRKELAGKYDESQSRRLNRFLLASVFDGYVRTPRFNLVELVTWKRLDVSVQSLSVSEGFMIWVKAALISGFVLASPWIFYQIWEFVAAGLYPQEKHFIHIFLPFSLALFLAGAAMAFFFVFEPVLDFFFSFNRKMNIEAAPRISEWLSFMLFLPVGFGVSFQLPLVMLFLERIGIFTVSSYISKWRISILAIFVIAMVLTPSADPVSMLMMAVPLTFLYLGGILLCLYMPRRTSPVGRGYDP